MPVIIAERNVEQTGDGSGGCGLAGSIRTEERDNFAVGHLDRKASQDEDHLVVDHFKVRYFEQRSTSTNDDEKKIGL